MITYLNTYDTDYEAADLIRVPYFRVKSIKVFLKRVELYLPICQHGAFLHFYTAKQPITTILKLNKLV